MRKKPNFIFFITLTSLFLVSLAILAQSSHAVELPPSGSVVYVQTNGPTSPITKGDWYTSNSNSAGGNMAGYHYIAINIPGGWPITRTVFVDIFSAEMNTSFPLQDEDDNGTPNNTTFEMFPAGTTVGPNPNQPASGTGIASSMRSYSPSSATETWTRFYTMTAPVAPGTYFLRSQALGDDQNGWRLRVGNDNDTNANNAPPANYDNPDGVAGTDDEITIGLSQTSYQHDAGVTACFTLYQYASPGQASIAFHNFDLDGNGTINYTSPTGVVYTGTVSVDSSWNTGSTTSRGTGDVINNPTTGWWQILTCASDHNQFIQEGQTGLASYYSQPPSPRIIVSKTDGTTFAIPNQPLTYTIAFTNTSNVAPPSTPVPGAAKSLVLTDTIPTGLTYQSCGFNSPMAGTCTQTGGNVRFTLNNTINAGASGSVFVRVQTGAAISGTITNTVTLNYHDGLNNVYPNVSASDADRLQPTLATVESLKAIRTTAGTLIEWKTSYEVDNLGFNVYRQERGQKNKLNPSIVAGSAFQAAGNAPSGQGYLWWDRDVSGKGQATYWLEDVDMNGTATLHGPYLSGPATTLTSNEVTNKYNSPLLETLGQTDGSRNVNQVHQINPKSKRPEGTRNPNSKIDQVDLAGMSAAKIGVDHEGWYKVTQSELIAAGIAAGTDPRNLQMYVGGQQVAVRVNGEADGRFDPTDSVEFYGVGLDTQATATQVYWLLAGTTQGLRIQSHYSPAKGPDASSFPYTIERRDHTIYFSSLLNGDAENFFGQAVASQSVNQDLAVTALNTSSQIAPTLEVSLQGVTNEAHDVHVSFNGVEVGHVTYSGQEHPIATFPLTPAALHDGVNTVSFVGTAGSYDVSLVDHVALTYPHLFRADSNTLSFTAQGGDQIRVDGFSTSHIRLVDVTDPMQPTELTGHVSASSGAYTILATAMGKGERTLIGLADGVAQSPQSIVANIPSSWKSFSPGADLVIVTNPSFRTSLEPLVALRRSEGHTVAVLDVDDVYDEFNYGAHSPQAIRDLVAWARSHWAITPKYLLLVGDSSLDPKNYLGFGNWDLVPTRLIDTENMETASDDWLADTDANGLADLAVGRLPVRSVAQADLVIGKIVTAGQPRRSLQPKGAVMVADADQSFEAGMASMRAALPSGVPALTINRSSGSTGDVHDRIVSALNAGPQIVTFFGHGNVDTWTSDGLLTSNDASALQNGNRMPIFVMMTCLNGYFQDPSLTSLSEAMLLSENGGAQAVWASSGIAMPSEQVAMGSAFIQALYGTGKGGITFGEASMRAKASITDPGLRRTWILFGDPSARLK